MRKIIYVSRPLAKDELMHGKFKYIHKRKVNGKWRYYYIGDSIPGSAMAKDGAIGIEYEKTSGNKNSKYGTYENNYLGNSSKVTVKKGNGLLGSESTIVNPGGSIARRTVEVGKVEQKLDKVSNLSKKQIDKTKKWLGSFKIGNETKTTVSVKKETIK